MLASIKVVSLGPRSSSCANSRKSAATITRSTPEKAATVTPAAPTPQVVENVPKVKTLEDRFREAYTMSQVYVKDRPAPIPLTEYEKRRRARELQEITEAGKKKGVKAELIRTNLEQINSLLPGLVNLHKAKASDWLAIVSDVNSLLGKLIVLKELFPKANLEKVLAAQPKLLLKTEQQLKQDGEKVLKMLSTVPDPDAIIENVPALINPVELMRALTSIKTSFGVDPLELLSKHPDVLYNMGEANIADSAEYGELSTKD